MNNNIVHPTIAEETILKNRRFKPHLAFDVVFPFECISRLCVCGCLGSMDVHSETIQHETYINEGKISCGSVFNFLLIIIDSGCMTGTINDSLNGGKLHFEVDLVLFVEWNRLCVWYQFNEFKINELRKS